MTDTEANIERNRLAKFSQLSDLRRLTHEALAMIRADDVNGPQGPFTGNTRESRDVEALRIFFSKTNGGAPAVEMTVHNLGIAEASQPHLRLGPRRRKNKCAIGFGCADLLSGE